MCWAYCCELASTQKGFEGSNQPHICNLQCQFHTHTCAHTHIFNSPEKVPSFPAQLLSKSLGGDKGVLQSDQDNVPSPCLGSSLSPASTLCAVGFANPTATPLIRRNQTRKVQSNLKVVHSPESEDGVGVLHFPPLKCTRPTLERQPKVLLQ